MHIDSVTRTNVIFLSVASVPAILFAALTVISAPMFPSNRVHPDQPSGALMNNESANVGCESLSREVEVMLAAQKSLSASSLRVQKLIAEQYLDLAETFEGKGRKLSKLDIVSMKSASESLNQFRLRQLELQRRFESSSRVLQEKIQRCTLLN